jgi:hypothetical protein
MHVTFYLKYIGVFSDTGKIKGKIGEVQSTTFSIADLSPYLDGEVNINSRVSFVQPSRIR